MNKEQASLDEQVTKSPYIFVGGRFCKSSTGRFKKSPYIFGGEPYGNRSLGFVIYG